MPPIRRIQVAREGLVSQRIDSLTQFTVNELTKAFRRVWNQSQVTCNFQQPFY